MQIHATIHNGQIALPHPLDLPEGTVVLVTTNLASAAEQDDDLLGDSPEAIARWREGIKTLQQITMSEEEITTWEARLEEEKRWEKEHADQHHEKLMKDICP
ncbi:MAG: hypothetical protein QM811_00070 [Pirellulales bacterium]